MNARWLGGPLVAAALGSVAAGCGGGHQQSAVSVVRTAYSQTVAAKTARVRFTGVLHSTAGGTGAGFDITISGQGAEDFASRRVELTMALPLGVGAVDERILGGVLYLRLPAQLSAQRPAGKAWLRVDLNALARQTLGSPLSSLTPGGTSDPGDLLGYLQGLSDSGLTEVGSDTIDGAPTTHYRGVIDLNRAADKLPAAAAAALRQMISRLGTGRQPVDVWVDDQGRARQLRMDLGLPANAFAGTAGRGSTPRPGGAGGAGATMTITVAFSGFGEPVSIVAPPPDQVADAASLPGYQRLLGGAGTPG